MTYKVFRDVLRSSSCDVPIGSEVYAREINSNKMRRVLGIKIVHSYVDNGELINWLEIEVESDKGDV